MSALELDVRDLRVAGGLMLVCAAGRAAADSELGIPCPLRELTGVPCPFCGLTTSVTETLRLDLGDALAANPGGVAAAAVAAALLIRRPERLRIPVTLLCAVLAALWLFQLQRFALL